MKKISKNIIIFVIAFAIIFCGLLSTDVLIGLKETFGSLGKILVANEGFEAFNEFTDNVENVSGQGLFYHKNFVDINSSVNNNMGTVLIHKDDMTVVKSKTGYLSYVRKKIPGEILKKRAENIAELAKASEQNGADFLYVMAPVKGYNMEYPENIADFNRENCIEFIKELENADIPYYSLISQMEEEGITEEEMFFVTDHHWKPEYALWAVNKVAEEFEKRFKFSYDKEKLNIKNYNEKVYEKWFLGSQGKKTGQYFTELGLDDISLFIPKFKTSFINTHVGKYYSSQGTFEDVLLHKEHIETKDLYNKNPYAAYLGGDYREQIIENTENKNGKSVLILKDSFSCAFAPFFANVVKNTYLLDMRDFDEFAGERIDVFEYIRKAKPDIVMVMYTGVTSDDGVFEFR